MTIRNHSQRRARSLLKLLEKNEQAYQGFRERATKAGHWDQVAGLNAHIKGLQQAQGCVRYIFEMKPKRKRK